MKSFILELLHNDTIFAFKFAFNNEYGENIRIALQVSDNKKRAVALLANNYFKESFRTNELFPIENDNSNISAFMPYLNNTIAYGLYTIPVDHEYSYISTLEDAFSQVIIEAFGDDLIDEEMILTFALYLLFSCYKTLSLEPLAIKKWLDYYQNVNESLKSDEFNDEFIEENYHPVKETVDEIYTDTLNGGCSNLAWIAKWENVFSKALGKINLDKNAILFFVQVNEIINKHLNLGLDSQFLLSAILNKTITKPIS